MQNVLKKLLKVIDDYSLTVHVYLFYAMGFSKVFPHGNSENEILFAANSSQNINCVILHHFNPKKLNMYYINCKKFIMISLTKVFLCFDKDCFFTGCILYFMVS